MSSARWRHWRRKVHEILELGSDAHPASYIVNGFIIVLIVANALAFAAETVDELAVRYGAWFRAFNVFSGNGVHHRVCAARLELGGDSDPIAHAALACAGGLR
jgi:hypothetical protein